MMENVFNIKNKNERVYILPEQEADSDGISNIEKRYKETAVILHLYYDSVEDYYRFIEEIPSEMDLYVISSRQTVLNLIEDHFIRKKKRIVNLILKPNIGRDISALLIASKEIIDKHKYVCFLHDKRAHSPELKADVDLWVKNLWGNLIGSTTHIGQIIQLFENDDKLGILAPPDPVGEYFCTWYGFGWHGSYEITKELGDVLGLNVPIEREYPPITIGTCLWFRCVSLKKLFDHEWRYEDFVDANLSDPKYISYGIERIFAYVAQDAGFDTGEVMSVEYACKQTVILKKNMQELFGSINDFFPFPCVSDIRILSDRLIKMERYAERYDKVALYGCGDYGRFCAGYLRRKGIEPHVFLVSGKTKDDKVDNICVKSIDEFSFDNTVGIIIAIYNSRSRAQIENTLRQRGISNYHVFWDVG